MYINAIKVKPIINNIKDNTSKYGLLRISFCKIKEIKREREREKKERKENDHWEMLPLMDISIS